MERNSSFRFVFVIAALLFIFSVNTLVANAIDKQAIARRAMAEKHKYNATADNFNGEVDIAFGSPVEKYTIVLTPKALLGVPKGAGAKNGMTNWKDVAAYEKTMAKDTDPIAQWFVESAWRDRINQALKKLEKKLKERYPGDYKKISISVGSVAVALGIDPRAGFLTGERFVKVPGGFGGRLPKIDVELAKKALDSSNYLSMYMSSSPFINKIIEATEDPETSIQPVSEAS